MIALIQRRVHRTEHQTPVLETFVIVQLLKNTKFCHLKPTSNPFASHPTALPLTAVTSCSFIPSYGIRMALTLISGCAWNSFQDNIVEDRFFTFTV